MSARTCGWCDTVVTDGAETNCPNCGGVLPLPPGADPGPPPPRAPREIPVRYRRRVLYWRNVLVLIGILFTVVFCWTVIFPIIGIPLWYFGMKRGRGKLAALERGRAARAEITEVFQDTSTTLNGRQPWVVRYAFDLPDGRQAEGRAQGWEAENGRRRPGQPLWVVYLEEDHSQSAIWPPIR